MRHVQVAIDVSSLRCSCCARACCTAALPPEDRFVSPGPVSLRVRLISGCPAGPAAGADAACVGPAAGAADDGPDAAGAVAGWAAPGTATPEPVGNAPIWACCWGAAAEG